MLWKCSTRQSFIFPKWQSFKIGTLAEKLQGKWKDPNQQVVTEYCCSNNNKTRKIFLHSMKRSKNNLVSFRTIIFFLMLWLESGNNNYSANKNFFSFSMPGIIFPHYRNKLCKEHIFCKWVYSRNKLYSGLLHHLHTPWHKQMCHCSRLEETVCMYMCIKPRSYILSLFGVWWIYTAEYRGALK